MILVLAITSTNAQKAELVVQTRHTGFVTSVAFSPDGKTLASSGMTIKLWDINTGQELKTLSRQHTSWIHTVAVSPYGKTLASGNEDKTIKLWDINSDQELKTLKGHTGGVRPFDPTTHKRSEF